MAIKTVLFDCGGVVLRPQQNGTYEKWEKRLGYQPGELAQRLWESEAYRRAELGLLSEDAFWAEIAPALPLHAPEELELMRHELWDVFTPDADVLDWVQRLRSCYRVAILSNATDVLEDMLHNRFRIASYFDAIYSSARLGAAKPDVTIYNLALSSLGISAGEALFIDDKAENVASAARLGMHIIWYVGSQELGRQLQVYLPWRS